ncbi:putative small secreted protein [Ensifer mexicanus]|uniref:Entericidin n=1 Tax=Sinorhizobium mexicanum TaxID=375549 RepID=A0A859QD81_9HYPH|nr:putative small secreted protein [Sinorhizobium mexicanum]QLL62012.1 entericidin [Sinorhizobium mexicanum]
MSKAVIAVLCLGLLALSSCANTVRGFAQDSAQTGNAVGGATDRVLRAGAQ